MTVVWTSEVTDRDKDKPQPPMKENLEIPELHPDDPEFLHQYRVFLKDPRQMY